MKVKYFIIFISAIIIVGWNYYNCCENDNISIKKRTLLVNNTNYFIKGVCYHPVKIGEENRSFENIDQDLELMIEAGVNTIRVYSPIDDIKILDKISEAGIKIIIGIGSLFFVAPGIESMVLGLLITLPMLFLQFSKKN